MHLSDILRPERVLSQVDCNSKKAVLDLISEVVSTETGLEQQTLFDAILTRERLGSTGIGEGVAIPHARIPGLAEAIGCLLVLENQVDFDAIDSQPVDIIFGLLVPEEASEAHLQLLSQLAELLNQAEIRRAIREATEAGEIYRLITE